MSFDLEIWSSKPVESDNLSSLSWNEDGGGWTRVEGSSFVQVWRSTPVLLEDVPEQIVALLPGIAFLTRITLVHPTVKVRLHRLATQIAKQIDGIVFDPQQDRWITPRGLKRLSPVKREEEFSITELSWWTLDQTTSSPAGRERLLTTLERLLPEALPRRYGSYEPGEHVYATTGRQHFLNFLEVSGAGSPVWLPHRPVVTVHRMFPREVGWEYRGFRCNLFSMAVESSVLRQVGWRTALHRVWRQLSYLLQPFYGEVRVLRGYKQSRNGTLWLQRTTEVGPIKAWWWHGLPRSVGNAVVLGPAYQALWKTFNDKAEHEGGLAFLEAPDWSEKSEISDVIGGVPADLIQPPEESGERRQVFPPGRERYATQWPFGDPPGNHPGLNKTVPFSVSIDGQ